MGGEGVRPIGSIQVGAGAARPPERHEVDNNLRRKSCALEQTEQSGRHFFLSCQTCARDGCKSCIPDLPFVSIYNSSFTKTNESRAAVVRWPATSRRKGNQFNAEQIVRFALLSASTFPYPLLFFTSLAPQTRTAPQQLRPRC